MNRCTAHSKQTGEPCKRPPTPGRSVCHYHGGKIPRGLALPQTTTGRYSKDLPTRLLAAYDQARADTELLALRDDVALLDARLADVLKRVDTGESGMVWLALGEALREFQRASQAGDTVKMREHLSTLTDLIQRGQSDTAAWGDVRALVQERRRLVESEQKRLIAMQQMVTAERAMLLVTALLGAVKKHVTDRPTLIALAAEIGALLNAEPL